MGPTRFPYGQALGFANQFGFTVGPSISGTAGLLSGSTAPNVTLGGLFYFDNTATLTVTNLILDDTANRAAQYEGKVVRLFFIDNSTQIANAAPLFLSSTDNLAFGARAGGFSFIELMQSRGSWYELSRSQGSRSEVTTFVTNAQSSLNMDGVRVAILNNTGSTTNKIIGLSGGQIGQEVTFMNIGSNPVILIGGVGVATSSNMIMVGSNSLLVDASGTYKFIKHTDLGWRALTITSAGWAT